MSVVAAVREKMWLIEAARVSCVLRGWRIGAVNAFQCVRRSHGSSGVCMDHSDRCDLGE